MVVCCVCCVGSGLYDGLITRSEECYRVCLFVCLCAIVCDIETLTMRRPRPEWAVAPQKKGCVNGIETGFGLNPKASFW
jgi:hypothetical protein